MQPSIERQRDLFRMTATEIADLLRNDSITVELYAQSLLNRIVQRDEAVKAWAYLDHQLILEKARELDRLPRDQRGPLHGVAIAIKDVMSTKDMPTQYNSPLYQRHQPDSDSSAVAILRNAGALIFGKTTTAEFAAVHTGPDTMNPHDPNRTPGGSSSGSAAAVADLQVTLALGTQTAGSIIRPASFTGIFGMKPTYNAISPEGQKTFSITFDTVGIFARSIEDLQLVTDVFAVTDDEPLASVPLRGSRIAFIKTPLWPRAGPGTVNAMERAFSILERHGAQAEHVALPAAFGDGPHLDRLHKTIALSSAGVVFLKEYLMDKSKLHPDLCDAVENKSGFSRKDTLQALDAFAGFRSEFEAVASKYDAIITPSAVDEAPLGLKYTGDATFNFLWTGLHTPVVNIPAFPGPNGMPVGISVVAGRYHDQYLLEIAKKLSKPLMAEGGWNVCRK